MKLSRLLFKAELKRTAMLALPIIISEVTIGAMSFIATLFAGHLGHLALSANSLVANVYMLVMSTTWGIIVSIAILVSHNFGANDHETVGDVVAQGFWLVLFLSIPVIVIFWFMPTMLKAAKQPLVLMPLVSSYLRAQCVGVMPDFLSFVLQQFVIGIDRPRIVLFFNSFMLIISTILSYFLAFGFGPFHGLGFAGLGWGMALSFWIMFIAFFIYVYKHSVLKQYKIIRKFNLKRAIELWSLGWPVGGISFIEIAGFFTATLLMGWVGVTALAAHQIVFQYFFITFMVAFGLCEAVTVRTGQLTGAKQYNEVRYVLYAGLFLVVIYSAIIMTFYIGYPSWLIHLDIKPTTLANRNILSLAISFFMISAFFQLFESLRFITIGALRGVKDTKIPMLISIFITWVIGVPSAYILAFKYHWQGVGIWSGITLGSFAGMVLLFWRYHHKAKSFEIVAEEVHA